MGKEKRRPLDEYRILNAALMAGLPGESTTVTDEGDLKIEVTTGVSPCIQKALRSVFDLMDQDKEGIEETEE